MACERYGDVRVQRQTVHTGGVHASARRDGVGGGHPYAVRSRGRPGIRRVGHAWRGRLPRVSGASEGASGGAGVGAAAIRREPARIPGLPGWGDSGRGAGGPDSVTDGPGRAGRGHYARPVGHHGGRGLQAGAQGDGGGVPPVPGAGVRRAAAFFVWCTSGDCQLARTKAERAGRRADGADPGGGVQAAEAPRRCGCTGRMRMHRSWRTSWSGTR